MNWLWDNKEWVFSGAGVAIFGLLYGFFFRPRPAANSSQVSADRSSAVLGSPVASGSHISQVVNIVTAAHSPSPLTANAYSDKPGPDEIHAHLESLPVFQRKAVKESYVGLKVRWPVTLSDLQELPPALRWKPDHTHTLVTRSAAGPEIEADINIETFPRLKISHHGTALRVSGTIKHLGITGFTYKLDDVEIEFDE
jgi:hypothetical protein